MRLFMSALQVVAALGLFNVWLVRANRTTDYRGGNAANMQQEFACYGLPLWFMWLVGALKVAIAVCFIAGIWLNFLVLPAALVLCVLMLGALAMHIKVGDPFKKSIPALIMLALAVVISVLTLR